MMGERPDYDLDIFSLLVDLVERPAGPTCDLCLYSHIIFGLLSAILLVLCSIFFSVKNMRIQYSTTI